MSVWRREGGGTHVKTRFVWLVLAPRTSTKFVREKACHTQSRREREEARRRSHFHAEEARRRGRGVGAPLPPPLSVALCLRPAVIHSAAAVRSAAPLDAVFVFCHATQRCRGRSTPPPSSAVPSSTEDGEMRGEREDRTRGDEEEVNEKAPSRPAAAA
uniref:Uncharacterized protein n=1 Tax=Oryza sativa subsp. japonica TaxID=39947 RepID=Q6K4E9_ORYSJ|nr:hypothetical protein [Oryza sativa Japonica Group]